MRSKCTFLAFLVIIGCSLHSFAQKTKNNSAAKCGTMDRLQSRFQRNANLQKQFEQQRDLFNTKLHNGAIQLKTDQVYSIPVVFHIVLTNPNAVTTAQIQAQLDTLNKDYSGTNGDTSLIPSYFKSLLGKSSIQFCLAQQDPNGDPTTGINRVTTSQSSFNYTDDGVKYSVAGGIDSWDPDRYLNIWICTLAGGVLGYATFPNDGAPLAQGVVVDYNSLPGGSYAQYNGGKTLTHELGHYFNLYHIWGDDNGACTGTDYVDDTPNQTDATSGCGTGIKLDACTATGNGIMYQNYMDYSYDQCLVMFTTQQVTRMEAALFTYRSSLLSSNACSAPVLYPNNAALISINNPDIRVCASTITPTITVKNKGSNVLTSLVVTTTLDNGTSTNYTWTGSVANSATVNISLPAKTVATGSHIIAITISNPNGATDGDTSNDNASKSFLYDSPVASITEGFETTTFPPSGWDIVNNDSKGTWNRSLNASKTGAASAMIDNYNNNNVGTKDDLRLPRVDLTGVDSAYLTFQVAAAVYSSVNGTNTVWDTLEVLVSTDCGATYTSLYKKWGSSLITRTGTTTNAFLPAPTEWRKDSVNLINYISSGPILIAFRNTNGYENNIYLDDINLYTITINPNLKAKGFMVTPSPTSGNMLVQFFPNPSNLKAIQVYSASGQKIIDKAAIGGNNYYQFNISGAAAGIYYVRAVFGDKVLVRKIVKQ